MAAVAARAAMPRWTSASGPAVGVHAAARPRVEYGAGSSSRQSTESSVAGPSSMLHQRDRRRSSQRISYHSILAYKGPRGILHSAQRCGHAFHTSASQAQAADFYKTLEVGKSASQKDIKLQFYKLSKKWHPDVNDGSNESKQKFQEVSEAYATLSNEQDRRAYDRKMSSSGFGSPRASRAGMRYASDNLERRQTATYAWDYQKRHAARQQRAAGSKGGSAASGDHYEHGTRRSSQHSSPIGPQSSMFERFAERQRKREEATAARTGVSGMNGLGAGLGSVNAAQRRANNGGHQFISEEEHQAQSASGLIRFLQVSAVFSLIFVFATAARGSTATPEPRRRK